MPRYSLDNVTIDGFRGLRNLRLVDLGLINILVGQNNSGKTSVLEALSILGNAEDPLEWLWMVRRRDFGGLDETRIQSLRWCFPQSGQLSDPDMAFEAGCTISCTGGVPLRRLRATYKDIQGEPLSNERDRLAKQGTLFEEQSLFPEVELDIQPRRGAEIAHVLESEAPILPTRVVASEPIVMQVWEDYPIPPGRPPLKRSPLPIETLTPYSYQINRVQVRYHSRYQFGTDRDIVLDLIREFDPEITDIKQASFRGMRPAIYLKHQRLGPAPLSVFGDALRRAVLLAGTLLSLKDGGILLIDEIDTGIHVNVLKRVFDWLTNVARSLNVQIVATTHSLEAVDAMALSAGDAPGNLVTFHLDQTEQETRVKRIDGELLLRLRRERGLDVR